SFMCDVWNCLARLTWSFITSSKPKIGSGEAGRLPPPSASLTRLSEGHTHENAYQRETYIGPWLPDPIVEDEGGEDVTLPLMLAMEQLSPLERAAFLLHDVFGLGFDEVASVQPSAARSRSV